MYYTKACKQGVSCLFEGNFIFVFVTELGQQTHCVLYFLVIYFLVIISVLFAMLKHWNILQNLLKQVR